ncbi:4-hydroxy-tetrahydrodipicolinate synthase [bacterium]|nr:4-hydroxy-tetrahydrodipicolinate synthase [bacterium]
MQLKGSMVAIATPFKNGGIDTEAYRRLIEFQIENGTSGIVPCGTTGESATLTHDEHEQLIRTTIDLVKGRALVIPGTGSNSTREALRLTRAAKDAGADAALLITPYYNKPTQEGLRRHYDTVAAEVDIPMIVYNVPGRTGVSIEPDTLARLVADHDNIVAVKDSTGNLDWTSAVCGIKRLAVLSGDDSATLPMMALGAVGVISVLANIAPKAVSDMVCRASSGDWAGAREVHHRYFKLMRAMFVETNPMPVKAAMELMGLIGPEIRLPLVPVSDPNRLKIKQLMQEVGLIKA